MGGVSVTSGGGCTGNVCSAFGYAAYHAGVVTGYHALALTAFNGGCYCGDCHILYRTDDVGLQGQRISPKNDIIMMYQYHKYRHMTLPEPTKWLNYIIEHIQDWPANRVSVALES